MLDETMRAVICFLSILCCCLLPARAAEPNSALSCEQVYAIAQTTIGYRDKGYTLDQVLGLLKRSQAEGKLTALELETLRRAISAAFLGHASPEEIALQCLRAQGAGG
jgi:hypothetical protein